MSEHIEELAKAFGDFDDSRTAIKEFLQNSPLYVKLKVPLPATLSKIYPDALLLDCPSCKAERPFRDERPRGSGAPPYGIPVMPVKPQSGIRSFAYNCTACRNEFHCWVYFDLEKEEVYKVGQHPMWLPKIPKDIEAELGDDAELYKKALRNINEGYGIGACAYLRRLIEKYINPLLQLLYEVKQEIGANEQDLTLIQSTIASKDFTSKTKFAADIAPSSILVQGHNPLKEIHERLSVGLHTLDDEIANQYAQEIRTALEFIIRNLRRTHEERRAYAAQIKKIRQLPTTRD
jgi:hypothetical protein